MALEQVFTVEAYWDGPIAGTANYKGKPHYYEVDDDAEEDEEGSLPYLLRPLAEETMEYVLENWKIWLRWSAAFDAGETTLDTHPCLSDDRERYDFLKAKIDQQLAAAQSKQFSVKGSFVLKEAHKSLNFCTYEVNWIA